MSFMTLDTAAAKQADQSGKFIKETGKYIGKFTKAEALTATTGTKGVSFTFESNEGQSVNFSIYYEKSNGEKLPGNQALNAILACMKIRTVNAPVIGVATKYDFTEKKDVQYQAPLLLDLMNKPIGVVLQSCEYAQEKDRVPTGKYAWKIELQNAFEAATELTASEILASKTKPELLGAIVSRLADRPLKNKPNQPTQGYQGGASALDDFDIPF